jgi:hypothetical protein
VTPARSARGLNHPRHEARRDAVIRRLLIGILSLACSLQWLGTVALAVDDASVLPQGVFRLSSEGRYYPPFDSRYDPHGNIEKYSADYNRPLDSRAFRLLAPLDPFVGGRASLGDAIVDIDIELVEVDLQLRYGLTDRLTVGAKIPWSWARTNVKARVDSGPGSSANVGLNPRFGQPGQPPIIPIAAGGIPLSTEDVQRLLGPGLPGIPGLGFKRFESQTNDGIGDIEAGFRYQYLRTEDWRLALTAGVRAPTGKVDDPDNLLDWALGTGAWALLLHLNHDYTVSNLWTGPRPPGTPGELVLNGTFRYDLYLPDHITKRVPDDVNNPLTANKERVSRDLGDRFEFEVSARYALPMGFSLASLYRYVFKLEDQISGTKGFRYESLEEETARTEHIFTVELYYSTVNLYREKKFPFPAVAHLTYRNRFAGSNNAPRSQYIGLELQVFF